MAKQVISKGAKKSTPDKRTDVKELMEKTVLPKSKSIFGSDGTSDSVYINISNVIEKCLKHFIHLKSANRDVSRSPLHILIGDMHTYDFPKKFIGFFEKMRFKGNRQRHDFLEQLDEVGLLILKLEYYQFIRWFVCNYLKLDLPPEADKWGKNILSEKHHTTAAHNTLKDEVEKLKATIAEQKEIIQGLSKPNPKNTKTRKNIVGISNNEEVAELEAKVLHQEKKIEGLLKSEREKTQIILNLKNKS